jgi:hypothetical protein
MLKKIAHPNSETGSQRDAAGREKPFPTAG